MLTLASSKPSISVSKVDRSLSPTVMLLLELPPLPFKIIIIIIIIII